MVVEDSKKIKQNRAGSFITAKSQSQIDLFNHASKDVKIPQISVIIPAFNEERAVGDLIDQTEHVLQKITGNYEIIVIDDGSQDKTLEICREKHVITIHNLYNTGKGYALREGFKIARGVVIITIDGDGEHNPEEIPLLLKPIFDGNADFVLGTRFAQHLRTPATTVVNLFGNKLFNFLIHRLTNQYFSDSQCGFRAFRRAILSKLNLSSFGYDIETEMVVQIAHQNIPYQEIPISSPVTYYRKSNINRILDGFKILYSIFKTSLKNIFNK